MTCSIVSDSSCDLRMNGFEGGSVLFETVPLRLQVGEREFLDNDELEIPQLLRAMAGEKAASSTASKRSVRAPSSTERLCSLA